MSEERVCYGALNPEQKRDKVAAEVEHVASLDLSQLERMLIPLLNQVRAIQGKRPVIVPKG